MPAYAQERRPCYRLGRTRRPRALVPGEEACGIRRSAKGARGDQRRHTCQCPALIAMPTGFPAAIPANCSFQLCSFRGSLVTTQAAEASRAADDVVRRRRKIDGTAATSHAARCNRLRSLFSVGADTFASAPCMC